MRIIRTYPQPDSPDAHIGPRERAMAVFKYLVDVEPEEAVKHPLFRCIEHSYLQEWREADQRQPSLVPMLSSTRALPDLVIVTGDGEGGL